MHNVCLSSLFVYACVVNSFINYARAMCILLVSERSERDTYRGNTIENRGCLFIYLYICMDVCMSFCTLTLAFLC